MRRLEAIKLAAGELAPADDPDDSDWHPLD